MVEHQLPKLRVVGSIPICRSIKSRVSEILEPFFMVCAYKCAYKIFEKSFALDRTIQNWVLY